MVLQFNGIPTRFRLRSILEICSNDGIGPSVCRCSHLHSRERQGRIEGPRNEDREDLPDRAGLAHLQRSVLSVHQETSLTWYDSSLSCTLTS